MGYSLTKIQTLEKQLKNYIFLLTQFACDSTESNPLLDLLFLLLIKPGSVEKSKMNIVSLFTFLGRLISWEPCTLLLSRSAISGGELGRAYTVVSHRRFDVKRLNLSIVSQIILSVSLKGF